jgi:hypothetical protein
MAFLQSQNVISTAGVNSVAGVNGSYPTFQALNGTANRAYYVPVRLVQPITITQIGWHNGSGVTGNIDAGVYLPDGTRLFSTGATANNGTISVMQWVNVTDFQLGPGLFYFAISTSSGIMSLHRCNMNVSVAGILGMVTQASAHPLPAQATFATAASGPWPLIVASQGAVV